MKMVFIFAALIALAMPASAAEIDFSRHITDLDGRDIPSSEAKDAKPLDLATVSGMALLTERQADPRSPANPADKVQKFNLAVKVHGGHIVALSAEETALLKAAIAATYGPLVVGRALEILDPASK